MSKFHRKFAQHERLFSLRSKLNSTISDINFREQNQNYNCLTLQFIWYINFKSCMFMSIRYKIDYCYFFNCTYRNYIDKYNINNKIKNIWNLDII